MNATEGRCHVAVPLFADALTAAEPLWELRGVVRGLLADGHKREMNLADFQRFSRAPRAERPNADKDIVLEVMDFVAGWCSPQLHL